MKSTAPPTPRVTVARMGKFQGVEADYDKAADLPFGKRKKASKRATEKEVDEDFLTKHLRALFRAMEKGGELVTRVVPGVRRAELLPQLIMLAKMARDSRMLELPLLKRPIPLIADCTVCVLEGV